METVKVKHERGKMSRQEFEIALAGKLDRWVPACGGTETPIMKKGRRLLYCFNPSSGNHAYLDLDRDMILEWEEFKELFLN
jgi:hypothetical protein